MSNQIVTKLLGYFCNKIWCQEIPKNAQSGHTEYKPKKELKKGIVGSEKLEHIVIFYFRMAQRLPRTPTFTTRPPMPGPKGRNSSTAAKATAAPVSGLRSTFTVTTSSSSAAPTEPRWPPPRSLTSIAQSGDPGPIFPSEFPLPHWLRTGPAGSSYLQDIPVWQKTTIIFLQNNGEEIFFCHAYIL